jgi:hypothetical protein
MGKIMYIFIVRDFFIHHKILNKIANLNYIDINVILT